MRIGALVAVAVTVSGRAGAHGVAPHQSEHWRLAWTSEPWLLGGLAIAFALYALGSLSLWRAADGAQRRIERLTPPRIERRARPRIERRAPTRVEHRGHRRIMQRAVWFAGGWLALVVALVSPLDALGEQLFSAHMVQHELLMLVAAPLLVMSRPLAVFIWACPPPLRANVVRILQGRWWRHASRRLTLPLVAWCAHALALWLWHAPQLFRASLEHQSVHELQHASFFLSASWFWWVLLSRRPDGATVLYVFTTLVHTGLLGALLTFAPTVWYPVDVAAASAWGLTPLEDQQLGGLIMWVPAGALLMAAGLGLLGTWLASIERHGRPIALPGDHRS